MVSWISTIKAVLISAGVASMALLLRLSVPVAVDYSVKRAPMLWISLLSWLKPPYLYVLTNGIIITIVASSRYYQGASHHDREEDEIVCSGRRDDYKIQTEPLLVGQASHRIQTDEDLVELQQEVVAYDEEEKIIDAVTAEDDEIEEEVKSVIMAESSDLVASGGDDEVMLPPMMTESENLPPTEKPLTSSRFGHRKLVKASQEGGRALRVAKPKRNETLENTWKMIMEGKSTPLTRQLYRRSDTFSREDSGEARRVYKKSDTFRDRTNYYQSPEMAKGKMRKELSLSQDELNRRVEAFIKKFNEEMKLQRMESLRQYKEITSRRV